MEKDAMANTIISYTHPFFDGYLRYNKPPSTVSI